MIGDIITSTLPEIRAQENSTHTDRCKVTRASDDPPVWDPVDGETPAPPTTIYEDLPCRVRMPSASERAEAAGEHQFTLQDAVLRLDAGTTGVRMGDTVEITTSPQGVGLNGPWTVMWPMRGSHMTSARFVIRKVA